MKADLHGKDSATVINVYASTSRAVDEKVEQFEQGEWFLKPFSAQSFENWNLVARVATGMPIFKSLVWLEPEKIPAQAGFEPRIFRSRGGRLNY